MFRDLVISPYFCDNQWIFPNHKMYQSLWNLSLPPQCPPHPQWPLWQLSHIPGDEVELLNCMCVLVLTRSDGTLFNATSIQEEDIIELWIQLGQTHPKGVLWYSVAESVVLFQSMDEMLVMVHGVIKVMALCKEPIRLYTTPPSTASMRTYIG